MMDKIALTLLIIGGLNWGSVGLFQFDLVAFACGGSASMISRIIYTLVACPPCGASPCCSATGAQRRGGPERTSRRARRFVQTGDGVCVLPPSPVLFLTFQGTLHRFNRVDVLNFTILFYTWHRNQENQIHQNQDKRSTLK